MYAGLVNEKGDLQLYDGCCVSAMPTGKIVIDQYRARTYADWIGEASLRDSYLKAPYYKPKGFPEGIYRVGPLARINAADQFGTSTADSELPSFASDSAIPHTVPSSITTHVCSKLSMPSNRSNCLLTDPQILDKHVRATGGVNSLEGVGIIEAPRGVLIHHYKVNEDGAIAWANLIVATGHNNLAIGRSVQQVSEHLSMATSPRRNAQPRVRRGPRLRSLPELLDSRRRRDRPQNPLGQFHRRTSRRDLPLLIRCRFRGGSPTAASWVPLLSFDVVDL